MLNTKLMVRDKWLLKIGNFAQRIFWGIGYLFGFTLVTALSIGWLMPGSFAEIGKSERPWWKLFYRDRDTPHYCMAPEWVSAVGWMFLSVVNLFFFLNSGT